MIPHTLHIGDCVWNDVDKEWGYVALINGKDEDLEINEETSDALVTLVDEPLGERYYSENECLAEDCYIVAPGLYFWGEAVCYEHRRDEFDEEHDYEFYCPARDENCFDFEVA